MKRALLGLVLLASGLRAAEDGGQPLAAAKLPVGARPAAMGQAYGAVGGDVYGLASNPALIAALDFASLGSQYASLPNSRSQQFLAFGRPLGLRSRFGWAFTYHRIALDTPLERRRSNTADPDYLFSEGSDIFSADFGGWLWRKRLALGISFKSLASHLGEAFAGGYSGDVGLLAHPMRGLDLGLAVQDLNSKLTWNTDYSEKLPLVFRGSAAYHFWQERALISTDLEKSEAQEPHLHLGAEFWALPRAVALRAGWSQGQWSFGAGLRTRGFGLEELFHLADDAGLDYAVVADPLGNGALQQRISLDLSFELEGS